MPWQGRTLLPLGWHYVLGVDEDHGVVFRPLCPSCHLAVRTLEVL